MNGPRIILDKSTLQSLSDAEAWTLHRYFVVNIPPLLVLEILGDLKKEGEHQHQAVSAFARKLLMYGPGVVSPDFVQLIEMSLRGDFVPMDGRMVVYGNTVLAPNGEKALNIPESLETKALMRWRDGEFDDAEKLISKKWREETKAIDLEGLQRQLREQHKPELKIATPRELADLVNERFKYPQYFPRAVAWLCGEFEINTNAAALAIQRQQAAGYTTLEQLAPYAQYCLQVALYFYLGLLHICPFIGTRATNKIDLGYFFFLPFCDVFTSGDKFHRENVQAFMRQNQSFVERDALKTDLRRIHEHLKTLDKKQRAKSWPPEIEGSLVLNLWIQHVSPKRTDEYNHAPFLEKEQHERLLAMLLEKKKQFLDGKTFVSPRDDSDEPDCVIIHGRIHPQDPCRCGSGNPACECCYGQLFRKKK